MADTLLSRDASNRALRTFLQGLGLDMLVAVLLVFKTVFNDADSWSELEWLAIGFTLAKTLAQTIYSYVMRRYLDPSGVPTPLPPSPVPPPNEDAPPPEREDGPVGW
jgi:hypothetical protein